MFRVACPHCSATVDLPETMGGEAVTCQRCRKPFAVPPGASASDSPQTLNPFRAGAGGLPMATPLGPPTPGPASPGTLNPFQAGAGAPRRADEVTLHCQQCGCAVPFREIQRRVVTVRAPGRPPRPDRVNLCPACAARHDFRQRAVRWVGAAFLVVLVSAACVAAWFLLV